MNVVQWKGERHPHFDSKMKLYQNNNDNSPHSTTTNISSSNFDEDMDVARIMKTYIDDLYKEDSKLDLYLAVMKQMSISTMNDNKKLFCTQTDLVNVVTIPKSNNTEENGNSDEQNISSSDEDSTCLIAIRAPAGSTMEAVECTSNSTNNGSQLEKQYRLRICNETAKIPPLKVDIPQLDVSDASGAITKPSAERMRKSSSDFINDEELPNKKRRVVSVWDDQWINDQQQQEQGNQSKTSTQKVPLCEHTSLPSSLPGVSKNTSVDPIDIYYIKPSYDGIKYVPASSSKRIKTIEIMTESMIEGSMLTSDGNSRSSDSSMPWLADERGVSNFYKTTT